MKLKTIALCAAVLTITACTNTTPTDSKKTNHKETEMVIKKSEKLMGNEFMTTQNGAEMTLGFDAKDSRFHGRAVNNYNGSYTADAGKITFGQMVSTMMMGPDKEMKAEREYFGFLGTVEKYEFDGKTLILMNADGKKIVFDKIMEKI